MRTIELAEYDSTEVRLNATQRAALLRYRRALTISATSADADTYELTTSSHVGIIQLDDLAVQLDVLFLHFDVGGEVVHLSLFQRPGRQDRIENLARIASLNRCLGLLRRAAIASRA